MQINEKDGFTAVLELLGAGLMFVKFHIHQPLTGVFLSMCEKSVQLFSRKPAPIAFLVRFINIFYYQLITDNVKCPVNRPINTMHPDHDIGVNHWRCNNPL